MTNVLCIYHANCTDGFGAAWVVRRALGSDVEFYAASYQEDPPDVIGKHVIIVDFSYKRGVLMQMGRDALSVLVLDHHKSAAEDLEGLQEPYARWDFHLEEAAGHPVLVDKPACVRAVFDMERSGAMITWDYFFFDAVGAPLLLQHIQDRDLWRFDLPLTKEIIAALFSHPMVFHVWDELMSMPISALVEQGRALVRDTTKKINDFIEHAAYRTILHGYNVPILNAPYFFASEAGHIMAEGEPFSVTYYDTPKGRKFSLRSNDEGADVSAIATKFGGGGHRNAAGFEVGLDETQFFIMSVTGKYDD